MYPKAAADTREQRKQIRRGEISIDDGYEIADLRLYEKNVAIYQDQVPWIDYELASYSFVIAIEAEYIHTFEMETEKVQLAFSGIGNEMLSPWEIKPGRKYQYMLPALEDKELI